MSGMLGRRRRIGKTYRYEPPAEKNKGALLFWAEQGAICIIDERYPEAADEHFVVLSVRRWLKNLLAVNRHISILHYPGERHAQQNLVEDGIRCAREAQSQGDPCNPRHVRDMVLARKKAMLLAGTGSRWTPGALASAVAPEAAVLPPLSQHPQARPVDLVAPDRVLTPVREKP